VFALVLADCPLMDFSETATLFESSLQSLRESVESAASGVPGPSQVLNLIKENVSHYL
jgi:hypothetical protein